MTKTKAPDVVHDDPGATLPRHKPEYWDLCEICKGRRERSARITALHKAFVEFGYTGLSSKAVADAYDRVTTPGFELSPTDDIIVRLTLSQLTEAGLK